MNKNQRILMMTALTLFLMTIVFAPWEHSVRNTDGHLEATQNAFAPICLPPRPISSGYYSDAVKLRWEVLLFEWLALGILTSTVFFVLKKKNEVSEANIP